MEKYEEKIYSLGEAVTGQTQAMATEMFQFAAFAGGGVK